MNQFNLYASVRNLRQAASDLENEMIDAKEDRQAIEEQRRVTQLLQDAETALEQIIMRR